MRLSRPVLAVLLLCVIQASACASPDVEDSATSLSGLNDHRLPTPDDEDDEDDEDEDPGKPFRELMAERAFPLEAIPKDAFTQGVDQWAAFEAQPHVGSAAWRELGPSPLSTVDGQLPNAGPLSGRATAVAIDPSNAQQIYLGTAQGGVWSSPDRGATWEPLAMPHTLAVGALAIDPAATDTLFVGTGEGNFSGDSYFGQGLMKSTDKGKTFTVLAREIFAGLAFTKLVFAQGALYAATVGGVGAVGQAASAGLYRSNDGGETWTRIVAGKVVDVEINPAVVGEIVVSVMGEGVSIYDEATSTLTPVALPASVPTTDRIELARGKTNPSLMYLGTTKTLLQSADAGRTWTDIPGAPSDYCGAQCWYDNVVEVDPTADDTLFLGGGTCSVRRVHVSAGGPADVDIVSLPNHKADCDDEWTTAFVHPDAHAIVFDPSHPQSFFVASDGGLAVTDDRGEHWDRRNVGIGSLQFYRLCAEKTDSQSLAGGLQDNGTAMLNPIPWSTAWIPVYGGDGGACMLNLKDPVRAHRYALVSSQNGNIVGVDEDGEGVIAFSAKKLHETASFVTLLEQHPTKPEVVYTATTRLYESKDSGRAGTWHALSEPLGAAVTAIGVAGDGQTFYVATAKPEILATHDGGMSWSNIVQPPLPNRRITSISVHPINPLVAYVAYSGFNLVTPETPGHVFRTLDGGITWARFDGNLGIDLPVNRLRLHPSNSNIVYLATDLGVTATIDGGNTWGVLGNAQSHAAAFDLVFHAQDSKLFVGTHGRGVFSFKLEPAIAVAPPADLTPTAGTQTATGSLVVSNAEIAGSILHYDLEIVGASWLTLQSKSGEASGLIHNTHGLSADLTGLEPGAHEADVVIRDLRALVPEVRVKVKVTKSP